MAVIETEGVGAALHSQPPEHHQELRELYAELCEIGREIIDPELSKRVAAVGRILHERGSAPSSFGAPLSPRELDVSAQVAPGRRNAHTGLRLGFTKSTVKSCLSSPMRKLDASRRYDAVIVSRRMGLIPWARAGETRP